MNIWKRLGFKRLGNMRFPGRSFVWLDQPRATEKDIRQDVGDGTSSNVVMTPIRWLQRSIVEAPVVVDRDGEADDEHVLVKLLNRPNDFYSGDHLLAATVLSYCIDGNAYWLKIKNAMGRPIQLWYVPHTMIEPKFPDDGSEFIRHYDYTVAGRTEQIAPDDVIHFKDGIDPENVRKGLAPLKALMREVWTDTECAIMVASMLKNGGVPGVVISPDGDEPVDPDDAAATKEYVNNEFTREKRGKALVLSGKTRVETFGFSPRELDLSAIRNISEERVCAALGVPAAVVGFGTGVQQTKVGATLTELRRLAWFNGVIPIQRTIAGEINNKISPDFRNRGSAGVVAKFDNSQVTALQEDENERAKRIGGLVKDGVWTRGEGREATGQDATPADDVFLLPMSVIETPRASRRPAAPRDPETRGLKHEHSLTEQRIAESAPRIDEPPEPLRQLANNLDRIRQNMAGAMADDLYAFFIELGEAAEAAAEPVLKQQIETDQIAQGMAMADRLPIFRQIYERQAMRVATEVDAAVSEAIAVEVGIPDPESRAIVAALGTRAGLVDLDGQTKRAIFDGLVEGRAAGEAGPTLARRIRDNVQRGPWSSPDVRARVIARTETAFSVNTSTIEKAKSVEGIERVLIFDDRIGYGDAVCSAMNGAVVTLQEAQVLTADEHPNGTRSFTPLPPGMASAT